MQSWTLSKTEENQVNEICIQAIKRLFNLPTKTPSVAIAYSFGLLYATQLVDQIRFMFLHKVLSRPSAHCTVGPGEGKLGHEARK